MSYFTYTARQAFLAAHLYGRGRGVDPRTLVAPALLRTDRLAEMLASTDRDQDMILTGDAVFPVSEGLAFLAWLMPQSHWVTVYRRAVRRAGAAPLLLPLQLDREIPAEGPPLRPFASMPDTGLMASVRRHEGEWVKLMLMGNRSGGDHQHEDKGSFVLEFAGDSFAFDFGVVDYSNPLVAELKTAQRHNMLTPWVPGQRPQPANPIAADIRAEGRGDATAFYAAMDATAGWEGWFRRWRRTWDSPTPDTLVIEDDWAIEQGEGVVFHWTTPLPMRREGDRIIIEGRRGQAEITLPPGTEAVLEALPLMNAGRREIDQLRRELVRFGLRHGDTQPRLSIRQRGRSGTLRVAVRLRLKPTA